MQTSLRRVFRIVNGGTPTADEQNWGGDVAWATPIDLAQRNGARIATTDRNLTLEGLHSGSRAVSPGSLIVSTRAPIGYVAETTVRMAFNQGCRGLEPILPIDIRFFRYQLGSLSERLQSRGQGSTFVELSTDALAETMVRVPPLAEQRAIADYLDAETARIDALIAKKQQLIHLLEEQLQASLLQDVGDWRAVPSMTLRQFGTQVLTGPFGTVLSASEYVSGGIPLVNPTHIAAGQIHPEDGVSVSEKVAKRIARHRLAPGDLVMGRKGDVGRSALVSGREDGWICGSDSIAIRCSAALKPEYLASVLRVDLYRQQLASSSTGAMVLSVNEGTLLGTELPATDLNAQTRASQRAANTLEGHERVRAALDRQIHLLTERRQALITAAVTGEFVVPGAV